MTHWASPLSGVMLAVRAAVPSATLSPGAEARTGAAAARAAVRASFPSGGGVDPRPSEQAADQTSRATNSETLAMSVSGWPAATIGRKSGFGCSWQDVAARAH